MGMGMALTKLGDPAKALEHFNLALAIQRKLLGEEHMDVAMTLNNVAIAHGKLGDYGTALEVHEKSLAITRKTLGEEHVAVSYVLIEIGSVHYALESGRLASTEGTPGDAGAGAGGASFPSLNVEFSATGWGPSSGNLPAAFAKSPFMAFHRSERLGKVADFGMYLRPAARKFGRGGGEENAELAYRFDAEGDRDFALVDSSKAPRRGMGFSRGGGRGRGGANAPGPRGWEDKSSEVKKGVGSSFNKKYNKLNSARFTSVARTPYGQMRIRDPSVKIGADWLLLDTFDLAGLRELSAALPTETADLRWTGSLDAYDDAFDRVTSRKPVPLRKFETLDSTFVKTSDDPIIEELATGEAGNVFATDAVLAHLMAASRSVTPWDIVVTYAAGTIFLDVRDALEFELHTVNETAKEPPPDAEPDALNGKVKLTLEATVAHQNFTQQVLAKNNGRPAEPRLSAEPVPGPNPLWDAAEKEEGHEQMALAYRYRSFRLGPSTTLVARTTVHAVSRKHKVALSAREAAAAGGAGERPAYLSMLALLEYDPKAAGSTPWAQIIETQRGNVIATEIKNNAFKLGKAAASAMLAGADQVKLGFVSRASRTDADAHALMLVSSVLPGDLLKQLGMSPANAWGVLRWLVDLVRKHARNLQEGVPDEEYIAKFVLLRDPNKPAVHFYNVPKEAFEGEAEAEEAAVAADEESAWAASKPRA